MLHWPLSRRTRRCHQPPASALAWPGRTGLEHHGVWQPYRTINRSGQLAGHLEWLQQQFEQHHGDAEVVRQELVKQKGIRVSLRSVERAVQD